MVIPEAPVSGTVEFLPSQVVKPHWTSNIFRFQVTRVTSGPEFLCPRVLGAFYHCDRKLKIKNKSKQKATKKKKNRGGWGFLLPLNFRAFRQPSLGSCLWAVHCKAQCRGAGWLTSWQTENWLSRSLGQANHFRGIPPSNLLPPRPHTLIGQYTNSFDQNRQHTRLWNNLGC